MTLEIEYIIGKVVEQKADVYINSANGYLLHRTGTARDFRKLSRGLNDKEKKEYDSLLGKLPEYVKDAYNKFFRKDESELTYFQLSSLRRLLKSPGEFKIGSAVLHNNAYDKSFGDVIHVVSMTYDLRKKRRIKVKKSSLKRCLEKAFLIALKKNYKVVALPLLGARKGYGLNPRKSFEVIMKVLKKFENTRINKVILCFDNEQTAKFFEELK